LIWMMRVDFFCSSGPGGQSVNTTKSSSFDTFQQD
jgi:protein subunit release factor B